MRVSNRKAGIYHPLGDITVANGVSCEILGRLQTQSHVGVALQIQCTLCRLRGLFDLGGSECLGDRDARRTAQRRPKGLEIALRVVAGVQVAPMHTKDLVHGRAAAGIRRGNKTRVAAAAGAVARDVPSIISRRRSDRGKGLLTRITPRLSRLTSTLIPRRRWCRRTHDVYTAEDPLALNAVHAFHFYALVHTVAATRLSSGNTARRRLITSPEDCSFQLQVELFRELVKILDGCGNEEEEEEDGDKEPPEQEVDAVLAAALANSKALGKAIEYIRVLKNREARLGAGDRTCRRPQLLGERKREWVVRFDGGALGDVDADEGRRTRTKTITTTTAYESGKGGAKPKPERKPATPVLEGAKKTNATARAAFMFTAYQLFQRE
ncbi:hypothetical protein B0H12DRAFT_1067231 [Mycena haematopus]|nr:hypothetical protein B0H12DRAFT_1067231 [Mycena haematopus]